MEERDREEGRREGRREGKRECRVREEGNRRSRGIAVN
jgi:hypothetical protein